MYSCCKICGRKINKKSYSTIGNQKVCSIRCATYVTAEENDKCGYCGSPVWKDDYYAVKGTYCCCPKCRDSLKNLNISKLKSHPKNSSLKKKKIVKKKKTKFAVNPKMKVGGTNVAVGPRAWDTDDIDVGPGDSYIDRNYYHGGFGKKKYRSTSKNNNYLKKNVYNNYNDNNVYKYKSPKIADYDLNYEDDDDEDDAYGDINEQNYLNQYGDHQFIQKNENLAIEQMRGNKIFDNVNRPKNESHSVVHHGNDIKCNYCGFVIKNGAKCVVDNYGKKFDTDECFSNYFQGIPKPKIG